MVATYVHLQKHLGFNGFWKPGTQSANDSEEATVLALDREVVDSDEFQEEKFTDSDEVDAD